MKRDQGGRPCVVVMGVTGSGKSTVGQALATALEVPFLDADDLHPAANIAKMHTGTPLTDDDRRPWLAAVGRWLATHREGGGVVACSALKHAYRDTLRAHAHNVDFLYLRVGTDLAAERVSHRTAHFMPATLVDSQVATLEPPVPPERFTEVDAALAVDEIVRTYLARHDGRRPPH